MRAPQFSQKGASGDNGLLHLGHVMVFFFFEPGSFIYHVFPASGSGSTVRYYAKQLKIPCIHARFLAGTRLVPGARYNR
jgi:hypothetical protein